MSKYSPVVQKALTLHQKGSLQEAKLLYVQALEENPKDAQALQLLGLILFMEKEYESSIHLIENSIKVDPTIYEAHNNLGNIYKSLKQYDLALMYYSNAIALQPKKALAHNNIAIIYKHQNDYHSSLKHYELAIKYQPEYADAHFNLANLYYAKGYILDAQKEYEKTIMQNAQYSRAYVGLAGTFQVFDNIDKVIDTLNRYLVYDANNSEIFTLLAIYSWINSDTETCVHLIKQIKEESFNFEDPSGRFIIAYKVFLQKLLFFREENIELYDTDNDLPVLYIIGDSHCLSYSNLKILYQGKRYRTESKIIIGCKAWHLSTSQDNHYRQQLENILTNMEKESKVLVLFGEIDCRLDDGIIKHNQKNNLDYKESVPVFVNKYIENILKICAQRNIDPIFSMVPAPYFEHNISSDDRLLLKQVITLFNNTLLNRLEKSQLFDTFSITANDHSESNQVYHIDKWHLSPKALEQL